MDFPVLLSGLLFGLSLIVVIGAQNAFVLQQGALRRHVGPIVAICALSDALLIGAGVAGVGAVVGAMPWLLRALRLAGAAFLGLYGLMAGRRALRQPPKGSPADPAAQTRRAAILACLAFTWLNPGVYLDTLVLLGSVANAHPASRWWFGAGAATGSLLWFLALGFGAALLAPLLRRPGAARGLDGFVAGIMALTAIRLIAA